MSKTELFVEWSNRFHHFESFQEHFAELGIICYIIPDMYKTSVGLVWRGWMEWCDDKSNKWFSDDCGSYPSIHECKTALVKMVIEHCLDEKIVFV